MLDFIYWALGESAGTKDTLENVLAVAILGAIVAAAGFIGKFIWETVAKAVDRQRRIQASLINLHSDIVVWRGGFEGAFSDENIQEMIDLVKNAKTGFRYSIPASIRMDVRAVQKHLHLLDKNHMRLIRTFIEYYELFLSYAEILGSEEYGELSNKRKLNGVTQLYGTACILNELGETIEGRLCHITGIRKDDFWSDKIKTTIKENDDNADELFDKNVGGVVEPKPPAATATQQTLSLKNPVKAVVEVDLTSNFSLPKK